jgi:murein endopeptidase
MSHPHPHSYEQLNFVLLPQVSGNGYYTYSAIERQYGTQATIDTIIAVARAFFAANSGLQIGIGDMCFQHGAPMHPHHSHRDGKEIDIRPLRTDRLSAKINIYAPQYDRATTARLVALLRLQPNVHNILFNDAKIPGVTHWLGHDNHLHVKMNR